MLKTIILTILVLLTTLSSAVCFGGLTDHPTVVVLPIENKSNVHHPVLDDKKNAQEFLIAELAGTNCFDVIEPELLTLYAKERQIKNDSLSGTAKIAKSLGINYIFTGYISSFTASKVANANQNNNAQRIYSDNSPDLLNVGLEVRVIDTGTEKTVLSLSSRSVAPGRLINGEWSHIDVYDALSNVVKDAVHGKNGLFAKIQNCKNN